MRVIILTTILLLVSSCDSPLKEQNLKTWFYDLPIYADVKLIRAKLTADKRFNQQKSTDTTKQWYQYLGIVRQPYIPSRMPMPDSVIFEFSHFDLDTTAHKPEERINMTVVKLFQVDYFYNKPDDLNNLYEAAYDDLKVSLVNGHDISVEHDGKEVAAGKNISYMKSKNFSQDIDIVKRVHRNGSTSVRLVLKMGEK